MVTAGENISFSCEVTYYGYWAPQIICRDGDNSTLEGSSSATEGSTITYEINVTATASMNGGSFSCTTNFPDPLDPPPGEDEATNVPDYEHTHTFPPVTVHCKSVIRTDVYFVQQLQSKGSNPTFLSVLIRNFCKRHFCDRNIDFFCFVLFKRTLQSPRILI